MNPPINAGGKREGSGRPANWVRERADKIVWEGDLLDFLGRVAKGEERDHRLDKNGTVVSLPTSIRDRMEAATYLIDRAAGKAPQGLEVSGKDGGPINLTVVKYGESKPKS